MCRPPRGETTVANSKYDWHGLKAAQRPGFSRCLAAIANATETGVGTDSKTQKSSDLARRKAVGCNPLLAGDLVHGFGSG